MLPPRTHPLARAPLIDRLNRWLEQAWSRGWLSRPPLDPDALWAKASRGYDPDDETGGRNAEEAIDFRLRLTRLCEAIAKEARLNPLGMCMAHGQLVRAIRNRLALGRMWRKQPELLHTPLPAPIIIVGQMRSGTTRIHRLLSADPALSATRFCDSWHPVPRRFDTRPVNAFVTLAIARQLDPWIDTIHPFGVTQPDEELGWLAASLNHSAYEAQWRIPSFVNWSERQDCGPVYREFARILRSDASYRGNANKPRVMKVPQFSEDLPVLLACFPDARLIIARRDSDAVRQSTISLVANQMTIQSDQVELDWIESEWSRKTALRESGLKDSLAQYQGPKSELRFDALNTEYEREIARAYDELGLELSASAQLAMKKVQAKSGDGQHTQHAESYQGFAQA